MQTSITEHMLSLLVWIRQHASSINTCLQTHIIFAFSKIQEIVCFIPSNRKKILVEESIWGKRRKKMVDVSVSFVSPWIKFEHLRLRNEGPKL